MKKQIVVLEALGIDDNKLYKQLSELAQDYDVIYYNDRQEDEETLIKRASAASILVLSNIKLSKNVLKECPLLEMICVAFTGVDHIDLDYCRRHHILVANASGYATQAVVELTFGLIFDLYRKISLGDHRTRHQKNHQGLLGREISGKKFGIVGAGAIGQAVGQIAQAFRAEVFVYNRSEVNIKGFTQVSLSEIFKRCEIISIHLPLNKETQALIDAKLLSLMKKEAILINTARGPIIDNDYLAKMLIKNKISGAGIDVFDYEPPLKSDYKLLDAPNTILTPHIAYYTKEAMEKRFEIVLKNIEAFFNQQPINLV